MRAGMLADDIGRQMNERVRLKDIRPVLRRMANEGLVTTKPGDPLMYKHGWSLKDGAAPHPAAPKNLAQLRYDHAEKCRAGLARRKAG